jgi:hypothetical protein
MILCASRQMRTRVPRKIVPGSRKASSLRPTGIGAEDAFKNQNNLRYVPSQRLGDAFLISRRRVGGHKSIYDMNRQIQRASSALSRGEVALAPRSLPPLVRGAFFVGSR